MISTMRGFRPSTDLRGRIGKPWGDGDAGDGIDNLGRQAEANVLWHHLNFANIGESLSFKESYDFFDQALRGRCARRECDGPDALQPIFPNRLVVLNEVRLGCEISGDFDEAI
jgi:hypothetical protein